MSIIKIAGKKNLLLCFDAFGTLFTPSIPVPRAYAAAARRHGIQCGNPESSDTIATVTVQFQASLQRELKRNPNYGKAIALGAEKWWSKVISGTFEPFLSPGQQIPPELVAELLRRYSSHEGYRLFSDVLPFFEMLRSTKRSNPPISSLSWKWDKTIVGIITNSDDRIPDILKSFGLQIGPRRIGTADHRSRAAALQDDISFTVLSYDVGFEKPHRRVFDAATDMLKEILVVNEETLTIDDFEKIHIGDDLEKDYQGAGAAGWKGVLLRRQCETERVEKKDHGLETVEMMGGNEEPLSVLTAKSLQALEHFRSGE